MYPKTVVFLQNQSKYTRKVSIYGDSEGLEDSLKLRVFLYNVHECFIYNTSRRHMSCLAVSINCFRHGYTAGYFSSVSVHCGNDGNSLTDRKVRS